MSKKLLKNLLFGFGAAILIVVAIVIFNGRSNRSSSDATLFSSSQNGAVESPGTATTSETSQFSDELLTLLNSVEQINLNQSVFSNPAFEKLRDISIPLVREGNPGRPNPFAPLSTLAPAQQTASPLPSTTVPVSGGESAFVPTSSSGSEAPASGQNEADALANFLQGS